MELEELLHQPEMAPTILDPASEARLLREMMKEFDETAREDDSVLAEAVDKAMDSRTANIYSSYEEYIVAVECIRKWRAERSDQVESRWPSVAEMIDNYY